MYELRWDFVFLSTPSARRATLYLQTWASRPFYFYPRPPRGGRPGTTDKPAPYEDFYPRPPRGGRPINQLRQAFQVQFLSTPSARRATKELYLTGTSADISIHALREEGDVQALMNRHLVIRFLSTPSARRATRMELEAYSHDKISIHALREEGDS